ISFCSQLSCQHFFPTRRTSELDHYIGSGIRALVYYRIGIGYTPGTIIACWCTALRYCYISAVVSVQRCNLCFRWPSWYICKTSFDTSCTCWQRAGQHWRFCITTTVGDHYIGSGIRALVYYRIGIGYTPGTIIACWCTALRYCYISAVVSVQRCNLCFRWPSWYICKTSFDTSCNRRQRAREHCHVYITSTVGYQHNGNGIHALVCYRIE